MCDKSVKFRALAALLLVSFVLVASVALGQMTPKFMAIPNGNPQQAIAQSAAGANVPLWSGSFSFQGTTYPFTMVGTDPGAGSVKTKVPVVLIPLKFKFSDGTVLNANGIVCGGTDSATDLTTLSPLFQQVFEFFAGGTDTGASQYIDAFQRANFWNQVSSVSPGYHVLLKPITIEPVQVIQVPAASGSTFAGPCARFGAVDFGFFDNVAQNLLTSLGIPSTSLPIFLDYNTFLTSGGCCILGYHSLTFSGQTYTFAAFSDPNIFGQVPIQDVYALSHELGEWMDDPLINNIVPPWSGGQVTSCSSLLEVGDPLTGIGFDVALSNFDYHLTDLAFLSWFARQSPSTAINGMYSFLGALASPPPVCH